MAAGGLNVFVEDLEWHSRLFDRLNGAVELGFGADEDTEFVRRDASLLGQPVSDRFDFFGFGFQHSDRWRRAVENGDGIAAIFGVAVYVGDFRAEQSIGLRANLV